MGSHSPKRQLLGAHLDEAAEAVREREQRLQPRGELADVEEGLRYERVHERAVRCVGVREVARRRHLAPQHGRPRLDHVNLRVHLPRTPASKSEQFAISK